MVVQYEKEEKISRYLIVTGRLERRLRISALLKIPKSKGGLLSSDILTLVSYHVTIEKNVERWGNRQ